MPKDNFRKTAIRNRMAETGESYSVAARHLSQLDWWTVLSEDTGLLTRSSAPVITVSSHRNRGRVTTIVNIAYQMMLQGKTVLFATIEMGTDEVFWRFMSVATGIPEVSLREGGEVDADIPRISSARVLLEKHLIVERFPNPEYGDIALSVRDRPAFRPIDVLVVDQINLMRTSEDNINGRLRSALSSLTSLSQVMGMPTILGYQINRSDIHTPSVISQNSGYVVETVPIRDGSVISAVVKTPQRLIDVIEIPVVVKYKIKPGIPYINHNPYWVTGEFSDVKAGDKVRLIHPQHPGWNVPEAVLDGATDEGALNRGVWHLASEGWTVEVKNPSYDPKLDR